MVAQAAKVAIADRFSITHATFELECEHCVDLDTNPCCLGDQGPYKLSMGPDDPPGQETAGIQLRLSMGGRR